MDRIAAITEVFGAFARRDLDSVVVHLDPAVEFHAATAELARGGEPYRGVEGMHEYFADVDDVWDELRIEPAGFELLDDCVLVTGRVWARGSGRVVDTSAGWIWRFAGDGRVTEIHVFESAQDAERAARAGV